MYNFCTYFDYNFLARGLALYESLVKNCSDFKLYILVFDEKAGNYLKELNKKEIVVISVDDYIQHFNIDVTKYKDKKQFYFSTTPNLCLYVFRHLAKMEVVFYLDADMYFFNSVDYLFEEMGDKSIAICPQRSGRVFKAISTHYGSFNVGLNGFRNNEEGLKCLMDWKDDCDSWHPDKPGYPHSFFSDQIYLDKWPERYSSLKVINHIGIDAAPWNIANYKITQKNDKYYLDGQPLVAYHFSTLLKTGKNRWNANSTKFFIGIRGNLKSMYKSYINHIESFNVKNENITQLNFKTSFFKRLLILLLSPFFNQKIKM